MKGPIRPSPLPTRKLQAESKAGQEDYKRDRPCPEDSAMRGLSSPQIFCTLGVEAAMPFQIPLLMKRTSRVLPGVASAALGQHLVYEAGSEQGSAAGPARVSQLCLLLL